MNASAVIYERTPQEMGWTRLRDRVWQKPDGSIMHFAPWPTPEVVKIYRRIGVNEILDIGKE